MSRIAKQPVVIPTGVDVSLADQALTVKGVKGTLLLAVHSLVAIETGEEDDGKGGNAQVLRFSARVISKASNAMSGTMRALASNMIVGVSDGFSKQLELVGVGYRAQVKGKTLNLSLGYSHPIDYALPEGVTVEAPSNTTLIVKGISKQLVGQVAAEIRAFRPPEPYKGKGVRYANERIIRKETKKK